MAKNNLKTASKKSIQEAKINQLDSLGTDINQFVQKESLSIIENILGDFVERIHNNINQEKDFVTTGKINDINIQSENNIVSVTAPPHLLYQNFGVNGAVKKLYNTPFTYTNKMPPPDVFKQWIKDKNIRLINNEKYDKDSPSPFKELTEEEKINNAAWGMAKKVYNEGFKPRNIYSKEIPQLVDDLKKQIPNFCIQVLQQTINVKESAQRIILKA